MPSLRKSVAVICCVCLVAGIVVSVAYSHLPAQVALPADDKHDDAVKNFFAYHGTASKPQKIEHEDHDPNCKPCAAKAAALKAGGVPAKQPAEKVDLPYQRITGRLPTYQAAAQQGSLTITMPTKIEAWVSLSYGMPFEQMRCRAVMTEQGIALSSISGAHVNDATITLLWNENPQERLGPWAIILKKGAQDMWQTSKLLHAGIESGHAYGRYQAHAVAAEKALFMGSSEHLFCDDLELRFDKQGKLISMTHVQATAIKEPLHAARQMWLLIDTP